MMYENEHTIAKEDVKRIWSDYVGTRDAALREKLILHYVPLVRRVVARLDINPASELDTSDLISHGLVGLIEAVERFDPARGVAFETYASARIRGSVIDALRELDLLPRSIRRRATQIENAIGRLQAELGKAPSDKQVAEALEMTVATYRQALGQMNYMIISLDTPLDLNGEGANVGLAEALEDSQATDALGRVEEEEMRGRLQNAIETLPERERILLSLYYFEELTMREIGQVLNLSQSRVCQLHARSILNLRASLRNNLPADHQNSRKRRGTKHVNHTVGIPAA